MNKFVTKTLLISLTVMVSMYPFAQQANAAIASDWKAGRIIDDSVFTNANDMSVAEIQNFLNSQVGTGGYASIPGQCDTQGSLSAQPFSSSSRAEYARSVGRPDKFTCLNGYYEVPKTVPGPEIPASNYGGGPIPAGAQSAAQIIANAAVKHNISVKVLLVKLATESPGPLTSDDWPFQKQYLYAMGAHCPDSGPGGSANCDVNYSGFSLQMDEAAALMRWYLDSMTQSWWQYKKPYQVNNILWNVVERGCGGGDVYIESKATAALYTYTPYQPNQAALNNMYSTGDNCSAYGNRNFWRVFTDWFGSTVNAQPSNVFMRDGTYTLTNIASGKGLDVEGGRASSGTPVQIYDLNNTPAQDWNIARDSEGYYSLRNVASGRYLDVRDGNTRMGSGVQIWDGNGSCAQKWSIVTHGSNYHILSKCSGYALDVMWGQVSNGTKLQLWDKNTSGAQLWSFKNKESTYTYNGFYEIKTLTNLTLETASGNTANGTRIQIWGSNGTQTQYWQIAGQPDGFYTIRNPFTGRYLDVINASNVSGTGIQIFDKNTSCAQKWIVAGDNSIGHTILSACSGKSLDVQNGNISTQGTPIQIYESNGSDAQKWKLVKTSLNPLQGMYSIVTPAGMALEISGGNTANGTSIQTWRKNDSGAQQWRLAQETDGSYSVVNPPSNKFMDVAGGVIASKTPIHIWNGNGTCAQKWQITDNNNGTFRLGSACSNSLVLDVIGGAIGSPGTKTQLFNANGSGSQSFIFGNP